MDSLKAPATLLARLLLSLLFIIAGFGKLSDPAGAAGYMAHLGIPTILLYPTILLELGGGLAILFGVLTRPVSLALAGFCIATALLAHLHPEDMANMINFWKNLGLTGGFVLLAIQGAGALSIDAKLNGNSQLMRA